MNLELRAKGVRITDELRRHVERRLAFALARFGDRIRHVRVQLVDVNGPKGGEDIECQIQASLAPAGDLLIQEKCSDPFTSVARASERVGRRIARHLERRRERRRAQR